MKHLKLLLLLALLWLLPSAPAQAQFNGCLPGFCVSQTTDPCAAPVSSFLARTSGLNAQHTTAYTNLICGLVTDNIWPKLDFLHVYATQDSTTALLNLVSTSYNGVLGGAPVFTADRGFTGINASTTVFINTNFAPFGAIPTSQYQQNSAHMSIWSVVDFAAVARAAIGETATGANASQLYPRNTDGKAYFPVNVAYSGTPLGVTVPTSVGHFLANRDGATTSEGYLNGVNIVNDSIASVANPSTTFYTISTHNFTGPSGWGGQAAMASAGASLSPTDAANFFSRLCTYMLAVGVPCTCPNTGQAAAFLARTSGLDGTHTTAYTDLINGLITDGLFCKFDVLHVYATQDSTTALLNLVSTSYNATLNGAPVFTANQGFQGVDASSTVFINTGFNPSTAVAPRYTQNSGHLGVWNWTTALTTKPPIGADVGTTSQAWFIPRLTGNQSWFFVNAANAAGQFWANSEGRGLYVATRTDTTNVVSYRNGTNEGGTSIASTAVPNQNMYTLANNANGTAAGAGDQIAVASIGSAFSVVDATNFWKRMCTYILAIGSTGGCFPSTWDPVSIVGVTLSGGNLVVTNTGTTAVTQGAHHFTTTGYRNTGKVYFEITLTTILNPAGSNFGVGVGTAGSTATSMGNTSATGNLIRIPSGDIWQNGSATGVSLGTRANGDVIGIAVDLDNHKTWWRVAPSGNWNNDVLANQNPATNTGGTTLPAGNMIPWAVFGGTGGVANNVVTGNFGGSAFSGTVPAGFLGVWPL